MHVLRKTEEIIYPSSSSEHPTLFRLSETDQIRSNVPSLFFYKQGPASSQALKSSLSKILTFYYPLAGRLVPRTQETAYTCPEMKGLEDGVDEWEGTYKKKAAGGEESGATGGGTCKVAIDGRVDVSCLDEGALFCEAWAEESLQAFGPDFQPHPHFALLTVSEHPECLLRVQMTHFLCGGVCLCVQIHHSLLDGRAFAQFMKSWVAITSGAEIPDILPYLSNLPLEVRYGLEKCESLNIDDDYSRYYDPPSFDSTKEMSNNESKELSSKIFHFSSDFINNLKKATSNESYTFSSFECIVAFIWRSLTLARGIPSDKEVCIVYPVDGRFKLVPPLPSSYLGNVVFRTHASAKVSDLMERPLSYITDLLRKATSKVTNTYMRSLLDCSRRQPLPMSRSPYFSPHIFLNTWTSFPLLDFDFGWGKPLCWRILSRPFEYAILIPSSLGRGYIDLLIVLNKEHMSKLDRLMSEDHF